MITIASNARSVALRLDAFEQQLPGAIAAAFDRDQWFTILRRHAEQVLDAMARPDEKALIPKFVATVTVATFGEAGFHASMRRPGGGGDTATVEEAMAIFERMQTRQYGEVRRVRRKALQPSEEEQVVLNEVDAAIEEWVATEKRKGEQDQGLTNTEIAQRLRWILFDPNPSEEQRSAATRLARAISEWMQEQSSGLSVDATEWLLAVLAAWRDLVAGQLPARVRQEIQKLWTKTEGALI